MILGSDRMTYICKVALFDEVVKKQKEKINNHPNDNKWVIWKEEILKRLKDKTILIYYGILDGEIITEATAVISEKDKYIQNKEGLVNKNTAYVMSFNTNKQYEGNGYFSKLYKYMERDLKNRGFKKLTLGVEPCEIRNMLIYFNWGYINYIKSAYEIYPDGQEVLVNFYSKNI